jgi:hypothetical protein
MLYACFYSDLVKLFRSFNFIKLRHFPPMPGAFVQEVDHSDMGCADAIVLTFEPARPWIIRAIRIPKKGPHCLSLFCDKLIDDNLSDLT